MIQPIVILCEPIYGVVSGKCHADSMAFYGTQIVRGLLHGYQSRVGAYIDDARNELVSLVLDQCQVATHIFFRDQDMILPGATLEALLNDDKECVSATYFGKDDNATLVAWENLEPLTRLKNFDENSVQQVAGVGMGACLIRTDLFRKMEQKYGNREWFRCPGEDMYFCRRLQEMGVPVWLDGRIRCGHVGEMVITSEHWKASRST